MIATLVDRLCDGSIWTLSGRPPIAAYDCTFQARLADEIQRLPPARRSKGRCWTMPACAIRRSLKYECIYLNAFETGSQARAGIGRWITYYNGPRPHTALGGRNPAEVHTAPAGIELAA
jgi:transposase InsO family protein